ncbi:CinA family protein [Okibacterium endophyticum]
MNESPSGRGVSDLIADLTAAGLTVAVAESLTGGMLVSELIRPAGASAVVIGGVVAYATDLKCSVLGVDEQLLAVRGPVDPDVATAMAVGVRRRLAVAGVLPSIGIATTGVAGPDPQSGHAPGTVYIGVSSERGAHAVALALSGSRDDIRSATVSHALELLRLEIVEARSAAE